MKEKITPCIWFNGQAKEAAAFYCAQFSNAKIASQSYIVSEIDISGQHLILLDGGPMYTPNPSISFFYICETEAELDKIWHAFTEGGSVLMPLAKYDWSEKYGWLNDRFNVSWQFSLGKIGDVGQKITPTLLFTGERYGQAEAAIGFYTGIFTKSSIDSIRRYGNDELPNEEGTVKHSQIELNGQKFMIREGAGAHEFGFSEGVSLTIHCESQEEIDYYWQKLTEQGKESMCGWLKDRFGVSWQVVPTILSKIMSDPAKAGKAAKAFMQMRKLDIEKIVQASIA